MLLYVINVLLLAVIVLLFVIFKKADKKWEKVNDYLSSVTNTVNSVRYGNLATKIDKKEHPHYQNLSESINRMVETLNDREKMIIEYQTELTRQNKFLESILNSLSDGIVLIDDDYKILITTPQIVLWFGKDAKDLKRQSILDYVQPKDNVKIKSLGDDEVFIKNNAELTFQARTVDLNLEDNKKRYVVIIKDVTNQRELETLREDFVATLTHDLKVPIVAEANILEFLISGKFGDLSEKQRNAVSNMKDCNNELLELVQILLETYKIKERGVFLSKTDFSLVPFLDSIVSEMAPIAEKSGLKLNFCYKEQMDINADAVQMKRVIKNLIQNAISHSESSSKVDIWLRKHDEFIQIHIVDYGKGIAKEDLEKIFNKYYSTANKYRKIGTGLGLYLSQQIVRSHGGELVVNSKEKVSTEFCINLPVKSPEDTMFGPC